MNFFIDSLLFIFLLFLATSFSFWFANLFFKAYDEILFDLSCAKNGNYKRKYKKED